MQKTLGQRIDLLSLKRSLKRYAEICREDASCKKGSKYPYSSDAYRIMTKNDRYWFVVRLILERVDKSNIPTGIKIKYTHVIIGQRTPFDVVRKNVPVGFLR